MPDASTTQQPFSGDFSASFADLFDEETCREIFENHGPRGGGLPKLSGWQWLMGKVFHVILPPRSLLIGDRLFGTPSLICELIPELENTGGGLLFRVRANIRSRLVELLPDGSRRVEVEVRDTATRKLTGILRLREIHADVRVDDGKGKPLEIRLWTNLLDLMAHPARDLGELYAMRREHELFYRELKSHLHGWGSLMDAQTPESAAQEALALMMAASLIARQRAAVAAEAGVEMT